jgi:hypothetical protein
MTHRVSYSPHQRDAGERRTRPAVMLAREGRTWGLYRPFQQMDTDSIGGPKQDVVRYGLYAYWALLPAASHPHPAGDSADI